MKSPRSRVVSPLVGASLLALTRCSSAPAPAVQGPPPPPPVETPREVPVDLSPVPVPDALLVTVRVTSPRDLARRLGERVGVPEVGTMLEEALPEALGHDEAMARAVDLEAPVDAVVFANERGRPRMVLAFGAVSLPRAEEALSAGHRLTAIGNGVRRVERTGRGPNECPDLPEESTAECVVPAQGHCVLAPAAGAEGAARFVCAERAADLEPVAAYLTRTLPRTPLAAEGDVVVEASADGLRRALADDAQEAAGRLERGVPGTATFAEAFRGYLRDQLSPTLTRGLDDLQSARLTVRLGDAGLTLHGEVALRSTQAPLVQRWVTALRDARPSAELIGRLPPGATSFGSGASSLQALRPEWDLLGALAPSLLLGDARLPAADDAAVRSALAAVFRALPHDRVVAAAGAGPAAGGGSWTVGVYQFDAPAAAFVPLLRTAVTTLRRPAVARLLQTAWQLNPTTLQTPPTAGLPAGSYVVRLPVPANLPPATRAAMGLGSAPAVELALVPEGNTLWVAYGVDARARLAEARATHPATLEVRGLTEPGVIFGGAALPVGLAHLVGRYEPQLGRTLERAIVRTPGANAPLTLLLRLRAEGAGAVASGDFTLPAGVLGLVGATLRQTP